jgi:hypothetical protein
MRRSRPRRGLDPRRILRTIALAVGLSVSAAALSPALAADDIAGDWLFDTSNFNGDCKIKGFMTFRPTGLRNTYTCTFESEQICGKDSYVQYIRVRQSCTAQRVGSRVAIKSEVIKVLEHKPPLPAGVPAENVYLADNFIVSLSKNLKEMLGGHYDAQRQLAARFWRDIDLIS